MEGWMVMDQLIDEQVDLRLDKRMGRCKLCTKNIGVHAFESYNMLQ